MPLTKISLLKERITKPREYPFSIPAIASLNALEISSRVCFFVGENGTGKSTLQEAIAAHYGFGLEGGNRNFSPKTTDSVRSIGPLVKALRLAFTKRTGGGFYLRAESFFNVASYVDQVGASGSYGNKSLHAQSHGESFLCPSSSIFSINYCSVIRLNRSTDIVKEHAGYLAIRSFLKRN